MYRPIVSTLLQQIIDLVYKINNQRTDELSNLPAATFEFNGMSGWLDVRVFSKGMFSNGNCFTQGGYSHLEANLFDDENPAEKLEKMISALDLIYEEKKLKLKELKENDYGE